jgi:hypothetical protein
MNIHHFTSSALFLKAIRNNDLELAKKIATDSPWAVNGCEPYDH